MKLPDSLINKTEWTVVGPLGPKVGTSFLSHSLLGVDGGARFAPRLHVWVGDQDSYSEEPVADVVFKHPKSKDHSDLSLALSLFTELHSYILHLWGFLGGRKDHELFNLGEVTHFLQTHEGSQVYFYDDKGRKAFHFLSKGDWKISHDRLFSLGSLKEVSLELQGQCDYPLKKGSILRPLSSLGLSNRAHGKLELTTDGPLFLYFPEHS